MASAIVHLAIAKKVNEELKLNERELFLGSLAPDLNKMVHKSKAKAHFYKRGETKSDLDKFINKYKTSMKKPFEMGYYIHLYVDNEWNEHIFTEVFDDESIKLLNGTTLKLDLKERKKIIYNDFTNLNINIIDKYNIDLSLFYMDLTFPKSKIEEIPIKKLNLIVDKMGTFIKNSKKQKTVALDCKNIYKFIDNTSKKIIEDLRERGYIE